MQFQKIWISPNVQSKNRCLLRNLTGIIAIVAAMTILVMGGTYLSFLFGLPQKLFSVVLLCVSVAISVALALKLGWSNAQDATVFFLTDDDRLFVLDARISPPHHGVRGFCHSVLKIQKQLQELTQYPHLPSGTREIKKVESIKENHAYYAVHCLVCDHGGQLIRQLCFVVKGYEEEELLLGQLQRRQSTKTDFEQAENRTLFYLICSALCFAGLVTLCILSHPWCGLLPQAVYFPCLGATFVVSFFVVYFLIRHRRGE